MVPYLLEPRVKISLAEVRQPCYAHQVVGVERLVEQPYFLLFDEMGAGKTKQVIDAAQVLYDQKVIKRVLVFCPAAVRSVWFDPELGELKKHLWHAVPSTITEYHSVIRRWIHGPRGVPNPLDWIVTNYEYVRNRTRLEPLLSFCNEQTLLVLDESSAVKNHRAKQTKACLIARRRCGRVVLLNGTPIANNPLDLYSQGNIANPAILECPTYTYFRSKYAVMGGWQQKQIVGWRDLEEMQHRFAPHVLRRLKVDCLDLPEKLPPVTLTVPLTHETWSVYKEMRDELVVWLTRQKAAVASQAAVKAMRLAQITSGFLGGIMTVSGDPQADEEGSDPYPPENPPVNSLDDRPDWLRKKMGLPALPAEGVSPQGQQEIQLKSFGLNLPLEILDGNQVEVVGREKIELIKAWVTEQLTADPNFKLLLWCRFRIEVFRLAQELGHLAPLRVLLGGQKKIERDEVLRLLHPDTATAGPAILVGTTATGKMAFNFAAAHHVLYASNDYSLFIRKQSEDRPHRPPQQHKVWYGDVVATGPNGQKTIDHAVLKALRTKDDVATWTTSAWVTALTEE